MKRTQIQVPDQLFEQAIRVANQREISMAELVRRGLEYMIAVSHQSPNGTTWTLPTPRHLGGNDPFADTGWRADLHLSNARVAEAHGSYKVRRGRKP